MRLSPILVAASIITATIVSAPVSAKLQASALSVINITATAEQKFSPDHIVLHLKKKQTLHFASLGGVHGIESKDLGIPATMIQPDKPVSVTVMPTKLGSYTLPCTIVCGAGHADMALKIDVKK